MHSGYETVGRPEPKAAHGYETFTSLEVTNPTGDPATTLKLSVPDQDAIFLKGLTTGVNVPVNGAPIDGATLSI